MSADPDLVHTIRLALALRANETPEVSALAEKLWLMTSLLLHWHQPPGFRIFQVGYTCLDEPDQQERFHSILKRMKAILPSGPTLRISEALEQKTFRLLKFSSNQL